MNHAARLASIALLSPVVCLVTMPGHRCLGQTKQIPPTAKPSKPSAEELMAEHKRQDRREFQSQELMLAKAGSWIFKPGETPRVLWRDAEAVSRLGCDQPLRVRWFDAKFNESPVPNTPGRWLAWIESTAPIASLSSTTS